MQSSIFALIRNNILFTSLFLNYINDVAFIAVKPYNFEEHEWTILGQIKIRILFGYFMLNILQVCHIYHAIHWDCIKITQKKLVLSKLPFKGYCQIITSHNIILIWDVFIIMSPFWNFLLNIYRQYLERQCKTS